MAITRTPRLFKKAGAIFDSDPCEQSTTSVSPLKRRPRRQRPLEKIQIVLDAPGILAQGGFARRRIKDLGDAFFDQAFPGIRAFAAERAEEFDAVKFGGIMRGGDHHAAHHLPFGNEIRQRRGGGDAGIEDSDAFGGGAFRKSLGDPGPGLAGVPSEKKNRFAIADFLADRRPPPPRRACARKVSAAEILRPRRGCRPSQKGPELRS